MKLKQSFKRHRTSFEYCWPWAFVYRCERPQLPNLFNVAERGTFKRKIKFKTTSKKESMCKPFEMKYIFNKWYQQIEIYSKDICYLISFKDKNNTT